MANVIVMTLSQQPFNVIYDIYDMPTFIAQGCEAVMVDHLEHVYPLNKRVMRHNSLTYEWVLSEILVHMIIAPYFPFTLWQICFHFTIYV